MSAFLVDLWFDRRGKHPMIDSERRTWEQLWVAEVQRRQFLAVGGEIPELSLALFVFGMMIARKDEHPDPPPAEEKAA